MTAKVWGEICYKHGYEDRDKEIVRCKDCKCFDEKLYRCKKFGCWFTPNDFCSYGERKDK